MARGKQKQNNQRLKKDEIIYGLNIRIKLREESHRGSIAQDLRGWSVYNVDCGKDTFLQYDFGTRIWKSRAWVVYSK